jgi:RNA polymerase-associated protein
MRLYMLHRCPFGHRAAFALREKSLEFELVFFERGQRPQELEELGPLARSPTLFDDEAKVYDSQVVLEYLEDRYPEPHLLPATPKARAEIRMLIARVREELEPQHRAIITEARKPERDEVKLPEVKREFLERLASWDRLLQGRSFVVGDEFSLADITLYTLFPSIRTLCGTEVPEDRPHLRAWLDRIAARPSAKVPAPV